jgi:hypothetical protein
MVLGIDSSPHACRDSGVALRHVWFLQRENSMKRCLSHGLFVLVCSLVLTASAHAATANFQGNCTKNASQTQMFCVFDAQRPASSPSSCPSGTPTYFWDYGDGSSPLWTSSSFVSHTYPLPIPSGTEGYPYGYYVSLGVFCSDNSSASAKRYICVYGFGFPGCIFQDGQWY